MAHTSDPETGGWKCFFLGLVMGVISLIAIGLVAWLVKKVFPLNWIWASIVAIFIVSGLLVAFLFCKADHEYQGLD